MKIFIMICLVLISFVLSSYAGSNALEASIQEERDAERQRTIDKMRRDLDKKRSEEKAAAEEESEETGEEGKKK